MIEEYWDDVTIYFVSYKIKEKEEQSNVFVFPTEVKIKKIKSVLFNLLNSEGIIETIEVDEYGDGLRLR